MRLFVAIELSDPARAHLTDLVVGWRNHWNHGAGKGNSNSPKWPSPNWVVPEKLHLTLKFFGELPDVQFPLLAAALNETTIDSPIRLYAEGIEFFPPHGRVRVIAAAIGGDLSRLELLHERIESVCAGAGFPVEGRSFRPHVTLARCRQMLPSQARSAGPAWQHRFPGPGWSVGEIVLMESRLKASGSEYVPVARIGRGNKAQGFEL